MKQRKPETLDEALANFHLAVVRLKQEFVKALHEDAKRAKKGLWLFIESHYPFLCGCGLIVGAITADLV